MERHAARPSAARRTLAVLVTLSLFVPVVAAGWTNLGGGTGTLQFPTTITGTGPLLAGANVTVSLNGAPPQSLGLVWVTANGAPFPALGGTVWAWPYISQTIILTDVAGNLSGTAVWPNNIPAGTNVDFQVIMTIGGGSWPLFLSNGLRATP